MALFRSSFPGTTPARLIVLSIVVVLAANCLFVATRLASTFIPKWQIAAALRTGFEDGSMSRDPYSRDAFRGRDQYSDCITAQVAVVGDDNRARDAFVPRILSKEQVEADLIPIKHNACAELEDHLKGTLGHPPEATYERFWHGAASAFAVAAMLVPIDGYRGFLLVATLGLIALCGIAAALKDRRGLTALAPLLAIAFVFGGQVGFGQLLSYGPAAIAVWTLAGAMIVRQDRIGPRGLALCAVLAGTLEAFFDQMISTPLAAGIFLIVAGTIAQQRWPVSSLRAACFRMAAFTGAWSLGLVGSYACKLALSAGVSGWAALQEFAVQLSFRLGTADPELGLPVGHGISRFGLFGENVMRMLGASWRLTYSGNDEGGLGALLLMWIGLAGWLIAALRFYEAWKAGRGKPMLISGLPYIFACTCFAIWVLAFPEHTWRHAFFMARSGLIWVAGGWGWVFSARALGLTSRPAT